MQVFIDEDATFLKEPFDDGLVEDVGEVRGDDVAQDTRCGVSR